MKALRPPRTFLIIDDDRSLCEAVLGYFADNDLEVRTAHTLAEGLAFCVQKKVDVVLLDGKLPDGEGCSLCPQILKLNEQAKIIFITAYPSFDGAVQAIKLGAFDYLSKPFELEELEIAIGKALRATELELVEQVQQYRMERESEAAVLIGGDGGLQEVLKLANLAASADAPVLITGETGTGKDLLARAIHYKSPWRKAAFIEMNCAALPENLIEAELFGHEKGAFTGAVAVQKGIFEMAEGGTLLLNEIGEMPFNLQAKLLSALEGKRIKRLGGELLKPIQVRIIAATSVDLEEALGNSFREDLYYRLSVIRIHMPPLRERRQDIPELARYLLGRLARGTAATIPEGEMAGLMDYHWPGNVRELKNILERTCLLQKGPALHPSAVLASRGAPAKNAAARPGPAEDFTTLAEVEKRYIERVLKEFSHNVSQTAKTIGLSRSTLMRKIKDYQLP